MAVPVGIGWQPSHVGSPSHGDDEPCERVSFSSTSHSPRCGADVPPLCPWTGCSTKGRSAVPGREGSLLPSWGVRAPWNLGREGHCGAKSRSCAHRWTRWRRICAGLQEVHDGGMWGKLASLGHCGFADVSQVCSPAVFTRPLPYSSPFCVFSFIASSKVLGVSSTP